MKYTILLMSSLFITTHILANDYSANRVKVDMTRTPSVNTAGQRAESKAIDNAARINNNSNLIIDVDKKTKGLMNSATNPSSCFYTASFNCTTQNLSHQYQSKSWKTLGVYFWSVPAGITEVYVSVIGGQGGQGGRGTNAYYHDYNITCGGHTRLGLGGTGGYGGTSSFGNIIAKGGVGGAGGIGDATCQERGGPTTYAGVRGGLLGAYGVIPQATNRKISVTPATSIKIVVGGGGWAGYGRSGSGAAINGASGFVSVQY